MFHIHTPEPVLGQSRFLDVDFHDGVAHVEELHPIREQALIQHGYTVVQELVGTKLEDLTVAKLRQLAKDEGLDLPAKTKKPELIAALDALPVRVLSAADAETDDLTGGVVPNPGSVESDGTFTAVAEQEGREAYIPASAERTARNSEILAQLNAAADAEE
ncbi:hypothetical protein [Microbacterium sp. 16-032]|uniref:Rho termination factor N-terminal domain-containing protein n=1 Tax=Microbacterium sp. 16-032 TaxID=3239808 RepID=UPI0034E26F36